MEHELIQVGRAKDITGERFGRLVVLGRTHNIGKDTAWLCQCDCGNYKVVRTSGLKTGDYVSCGCKAKENQKPKDITGQVFGRLTAIKRLDRQTTKKEYYWLCKCQCGSYKEVIGRSLTNGNTKSCGCLARELTSKRQSKAGLDLTGKRFDRLVAIKPSGKKNYEGRLWVCKCDCGNYTEATARGLNGGRITSCGCKRMEHITKLGKSHQGKNNPLYNHTLTDDERATTLFQRTSAQYKNIRNETLKRDNFECVVCGSNERVVAHHLDGFDKHKDKRFELDNLVTLCGDCHKEFHHTFGYGGNTREQFESYFKNKMKMII